MLNDEAAKRLGDQLARELLTNPAPTRATITEVRVTKSVKPDRAGTIARKARKADYRNAETVTTEAGYIRHVLPNYRGAWAAISHPDTPEHIEGCRQRHDGFACARP